MTSMVRVSPPRCLSVNTVPVAEGSSVSQGFRGKSLLKGCSWDII